jgi:hypothetical protein
MEIEGVLQELEKEQGSNKHIMEDVTSSLWEQLKSSIFKSSSHQRDMHKCSNRMNRRNSMSSILSSVQLERKAVLKRKRALLIKQHKIDMEETRRCTEFLLRAKTIYCKQRFENARQDERQKRLLWRAKASAAEAQSSGRTPELNIAAPPGLVRLGSQSSFTGLERSKSNTSPQNHHSFLPHDSSAVGFH